MKQVEEDLEGRVAVIGMAGRFPGARDLDTFWSNLRNGVESVVFFSEPDLLAAGETLDHIRDPAYVPAAAKLDDIDLFDAGFFGMSPRDAAVFDPQHRLFLECAWEAFEHAGYVSDGIDGAVAVFASCGLSEYMFKNVLANARVARSVGEWLIRHTGNDTNFLATRVSYELDLHGPSMNVQTACSSTLVAVHLACQSLLNGECDLALAGGSVVSPHQDRGYFYQEGEILSPDGHCRAFDEKSAGTIISSAVGCVLLKPLATALDHGDNILAVIRGSAVNNDGRDKVGYLAPSVSGQAGVVTEALAVAGVDARQVSYVEAHGTGTLIGDPIEIAGITQAYRQSTDDVGFCAIGSLKTNIGHTGEAAGVAALIKTVLSLNHGEIPPSLNYQSPNPQADLPHSPFFVNDDLRPWTVEPGATRIAGITGLGAGGTNAHVIVEEAPDTTPSGPARPWQLVTVAARSADRAQRAAEDLAAHLQRHPEANLADVAFTRLAGRKAFAYRRAVVAATTAGAAGALASTDPRAVIAHHHQGGAPSVVFMMPGGGSQYAGMGQQLYETEAVYRRAVDACCDVVNPLLGLDLRAVMFPAGDKAEANKRLERPSVALPALFATEYAVATWLRSLGITPAAMIGHSAGEYVAACLARVITMPEGLKLVSLRGRLFETLPVGAMLSVTLSAEEATARMPAGLSIAAVNSPSLCVVSGPIALVEQMQELLRRDDVDALRVPIEVAAHSTMVEPILEEFAAFCRTISFSPPAVAYVSNLTGTWVTAAEVTDPEYWVRHLRQPVRFSQGIETILADPNAVLLEIGPGRILTSLARQAEGSAVGIAPTLRHPKQDTSDLAFALEAVAQAWVWGVDLSPADLHRGERRQRVPLPTYPFERNRYWVEPDPLGITAAAAASGPKRTDVAEWFYTPSWRRSATPPPMGEATTWLFITDGAPVAARVMGRLANTAGDGDRLISVTLGDRFQALPGWQYTVNPARRSDWTELVESLRAHGQMPDRIVHMTAVGHPPRRLGWGRRGIDATAALDAVVQRHHASLLFLAQALSAESHPMHLAVVTSGVHCLGDEALYPERALLHGACRVIPRELGHLTAVAVDVDDPDPSSADERALVSRLVDELLAAPGDEVVALRRGERWIRTFDPVRLEPAGRCPWKPGGVYLITGGLGGIGLAVAEHIAAQTAGATLVLVGRSAQPTDGRTGRQMAAIGRMRTSRATVITAQADVTDRAAMAAVVASVRQRAGHIDGVIHSAGILRDALIALRTPVAASPVVDVKAKGAIVLRDVLADDPPELLVLCSSVSSIIGLPGQVDYTAANAFLDAFALQTSRDGPTRAVAVNWNAWQDVGMAVDAVSAGRDRDRAPRNRSALFDQMVDQGDTIQLTSRMSRARSWLLAEHVVRGGDGLIAGTGFLEIMREAATAGLAVAAPVELREVFFFSPFAVGFDEERVLKVTYDRSARTVAVFSDDEASPHVSCTVHPVAPGPTPQHDLAAIRARCDVRAEEFDGYSHQPFMAFGPRWGNLRRVEYGRHEALVTTVMPEAYVSERESLWLHPAILDMATGSAQALIPGFDQGETFYVPVSYARVVVRGPIPERAVSHVRLGPAAHSAEVAVFDVAVCDEAGFEVITVDGLTMRRVAPGAQLTGQRSATTARHPLSAAVRDGISPAEGVDALDRILAARVAPQMVASSVDLHHWIARVDAEARVSPDDTVGEPPYERPDMASAFVGPRTPIERELAAMWRDLLGVEAVGRDDDFFELGGQSLIALRLFARMRKRYAVDLPLATLFEAPTIAQCAAIVAAATGVADPAEGAAVQEAAPRHDAFRSLVTIQKGGSRIPFFCAHGSGGNVLNFRDLSLAMGRSQPFYGLQARGVDGVLAPHATIGEMATAYLDEVRAVQPHGPYIFGGYSGGGLIAYEMAQQASAAGDRVAMVVLLDTVPVEVAVTPAMRINRLRQERSAYLLDIIPRRVATRRKNAELLRLDEILARGEAVPSELRDIHLERNFSRAAGRYTTGPWTGRVVLLRADEFHSLFDTLGNSYGWDDIVGRPIEVLRVPGNHDTILLEPNAITVVRMLGDALDRAQEAEPC